MSHSEYYSARWSEAGPAGTLALARCAAVLEELAALQLAAPRIVDLGCGNGWLTAILNQFGSVVGIDQTVDGAIARYPWIRFVKGDIDQWSARIEPADVVVSQEVIEHVVDQDRFFRVAATLLKPNGWLILTTPNARVTMYAASSEWRQRWLNQPVENHLTPSALRALASRRFEVTRLRTIVPGVGRQGVFRVLHSPRVAGALGPLLLYGGCGLHTVLVARKRRGPRP